MLWLRATLRERRGLKKTITQIISDFMYHNGISKTSLAKKLGESQQNLSAKISRSDLTTDYVMRISEALDHNFFDDLAKQFQVEVRKEPEGMADLIQLMKDVVKANNLLLEENRLLKGNRGRISSSAKQS